MSSNVITVYDINRIRPPKAPQRDDTQDPHFVPAPCQVACPVGTDAPSYIGYIWEEKFAEAFEAITATNPFSSICGRVCDAPCEPACRRTESDGPIAIRNLKRYVMDKLGKDHHLPAVHVTRKETVGIVGAGPAGLTAAQDLAEAGFEVHVYEMMDKPGGMMVWGIPGFRLPPGIIEEDMQRMFNHCPGIKLHCGVTLGKDVTLDELKARHDAVLLTIGSWWGKPMGIDGENHANVVDGVGFLRRINAGERPTLPEKVIVVGGGDVAMDACRAALRMPGVKDVKGNPCPQGRTPSGNRRKHRGDLQYSARCRGQRRRDVCPALRGDKARRARAGWPPQAGNGAWLRTRHRLRHGDHGGGPEGGVHRTRRQGPDGR
jgi:NADPH-dependent glutamate synthase beta subunit-like oxidoreductase